MPVLDPLYTFLFHFAKVNPVYDSTYVFDNDFPSLQPDAPDPGTLNIVLSNILIHEQSLSKLFLCFLFIIQLIFFLSVALLIKLHMSHYSHNFSFLMSAWW